VLFSLIEDCINHLILVAPIVRVFNVSGSVNYTVPASVKYVIVEVFGGSGGGGGPYLGGCTFYGGGGGGTGGRSRGIFSAARIGSSVKCVIGKGGAGSRDTAGGDGLPSSFGSLTTANGGKGGARNPGKGGVGGAAVQGLQYFSFAGFSGYDGEIGNVSPSAAIGGLGGSGGWGQSAGGRGACYSSGQCPTTGGAGSDGVIVITEFYQ
jgi:hypothetical protein